jgi:hypothetical protein
VFSGLDKITGRIVTFGGGRQCAERQGERAECGPAQDRCGDAAQGALLSLEPAIAAGKRCGRSNTPRVVEKGRPGRDAVSSWGQRPAATGDYVPWTPAE